MKTKTNNRQLSAPFVKYYTFLSYLFSPDESRFIIHMQEVEYYKSLGCKIGWSRGEYIKRMGLTEYSFDKCIKRLMDLELLTKSNNKQGNKVYYSFNVELYEKLVSILSVSNNVNAIIDFCDLNFNKSHRSINDITEYEVDTLKSTTNKDLESHFIFTGITEEL